MSNICCLQVVLFWPPQGLEVRVSTGPAVGPFRRQLPQQLLVVAWRAVLQRPHPADPAVNQLEVCTVHDCFVQKLSQNIVNFDP